MVNITKNKIVIAIETPTPGETLAAFRQAIIKLLHLKGETFADNTEVYYSTWLLQEMIPVLRDNAI